MNARGTALRLVRSPVFVVGLIAAASFWLTARHAVRVDDWMVMTDELLYVKLAHSIAETLSPVPHVHGQYTPVFSLLFPLLFAPFVGLLSMPDAFQAGHLLNAFLMASAAIPAYLLVRSLALPRLAGYVVAALTVSVPWLGMSMLLWTEAAAYPAFLWAILGIHRATIAPSGRNDVLALAGLALAFIGRTQFIFLVGVLPAVVLLHELRYARGPSLAELGRTLKGMARSHRALGLAYTALGAGAVLLAASRGIDAALGSYATTASGELWPAGAWVQTWRHLAAVTVAIGIVPLVLAAGWAVASALRPSRPELHAFALIVLLVVPAIFLITGSFTARFAGGALQDRYAFYAVPLLFTGMAACLLDMRRRWPAVAAAGVGFFLISDHVTYEAAARTDFFASPSTWFWPVLDGRSYALGARLGIEHLSAVTVVGIVTLALAAGLAALLRWRRPGAGILLAVALPLLAFCLAETRYVLARGVYDTGGGTQATGAIPMSERDWIDKVLPAGADAAIVPTFVGDDGFVTQRAWWQAEFWNKRVTRTIRANGSGSYTPFPSTRMSVDVRDGRIHAEEEVPYLVVARTDRRFGLVADQLASGAASLELIEPARPYRAAWTSLGIIDDGWTVWDEERRVGVRLHPIPGVGRGRRVTLRLRAPQDLPSRKRYEVTGGGQRTSGSLRPGAEREEVVLACLPSERSRELGLEVEEPTALQDGRRVGLRVMQITVEHAPGVDCRQPR